MEYIELEKTNIVIEDGDRGKNYPSPNELMNDGYCLFLSNKNIIDHKLSCTDAVYISKVKHEKLRSGSLTKGDIVITTRGTIGNVLLVDKHFPLPARINSGMIIIHAQKEYIPRFLYFYFETSIFKEQIKFLQSGASQPQLPIKDLQKILIPTLQIEKQQHVVNSIRSIYYVL